MSQHAQNEGIRVLDDFVTEAVHDPLFSRTATTQGRNAGHAVEKDVISWARNLPEINVGTHEINGHVSVSIDSSSGVPHDGIRASGGL